MSAEKLLIHKNTNKTAVSKTGYRALYLLRLLITAPRSREEILAAFERDIVIAKDKKLSKDTVTNTINTLKACGCDIKRPNSKNGFKYELVSHPFSPGINRTQFQYLQELRKSLVTYGDWKLIDEINELYAALSGFCDDEKIKSAMLNNRPMKNISQAVLEQLKKFIKTNEIADITYLSPRNGKENIEFLPRFLRFENNKLYLWGFSYSYKNIGYLRADKILNISSKAICKSVSADLYKQFQNCCLCARYRLTGYSAHMFFAGADDRIIYRDEKSVVVETTVYNEFNFLQKLMSFGTDCEFISPDYFKNKLIEKIKETRACYDD